MSEDRKTVLLRACLEVLEEQNNMRILINVLESTVIYDNTECDGYCLMNDIREELGVNNG